MAIQLGTIAAIGFEDFPPAEWLACFRQLGCTVVQAYRRQDGKVSLTQMQEAIAAGGMPCDSLHGVFGEQYDPSAPAEPARRFAVDTFKAEGELALKLGGSLVVVHCSTIRERGVPPEERARRLEQLTKSMAELGEHGRRIGARYAFENLPAYHPLGWDVGELAGILQRLDAPNTGMCFDSGHANMTGDAVAAVHQTAGRMIYMHFSDNSGRADEHEMPTYGTLDAEGLARALHAVGYSNTMMLEVFHTVDRLKQMIEDGCGDRLARILAAANGRADPRPFPVA
jgi:sugar phosphate isomerase/epimerase